MATKLERNGCLEIYSITSDWDYRTEKPKLWEDFPRIQSIQFIPGAKDNKLIIRERDTGGPVRFSVTCETHYGLNVKYYDGTRVTPYIVFSESILTEGHRVIIELWGGEI
jgi:hypothetical protein